MFFPDLGFDVRFWEFWFSDFPLGRHGVGVGVGVRLPHVYQPGLVF